MQPYLPIWKRSPNKFLYYKEVAFTCGNYSGIKRVAVYLDKNNNQQEEVAQVVWNDT